MASSIRTTVHESLPYIDPEPTASERAAAQSLIDAELSSSSSDQPPSTSTYTPKFTPAILAELERISEKKPLEAIDKTRYEMQDTDTFTTSPSSPSSPSSLLPPLSLAYATNTHLEQRQTHLNLLDAYGKNAWLVGNWQTEAELQALERDLAATKKEIDVVNIGRRRLQDESAGELRGLEEAWKKGVGRVLETEIATEELRQQVLERQRVGG
ncbi:Pre-mRNA-splicing factor SPF27 [Xylariaceae sp. FL0255]|nr:Pre-mRNA-splicing factor SPF27 [Xylariaceae sp. FL0255]